MADQCESAQRQPADWHLLVAIHQLGGLCDQSFRRDKEEGVQLEQIQADSKGNNAMT